MGDGRGDVDDGGEVRILSAQPAVVRGDGGDGGAAGDDGRAATGECGGLEAANEAGDGDRRHVREEPRGEPHLALLPR